MALVNELRGEFPWGLLILRDDSPAADLPLTVDGLVTATPDAAVVSVGHEELGETTTIRIWDDAADVVAPCRFDGVLRTPSGTLLIADALAEVVVLRLPSPDAVRVLVHSDEGPGTDLLDIVLVPADPA